MATGFRKSLFGFNCDDVMAYIESTHKNFISRQNELNGEIDKLTKDLQTEREQSAELNLQIEQLKVQIKEFTDKQEAVARLSKNIGRLYLVAQTNAKAIMDRAISVRDESIEQVDKNISSIDNAHTCLTDTRTKISEMSQDFALQIEQLISGLDEVKKHISTNEQEDIEAEKNFEDIYNTVVF